MCTRIMENLYDVIPASNPATPLRLRATAVQYQYTPVTALNYTRDVRGGWTGVPSG